MSTENNHNVNIEKMEDNEKSEQQHVEEKRSLLDKWQQHRLFKPITFGVIGLVILIILVNLFSYVGSQMLEAKQSVISYSTEDDDFLMINGKEQKLSDFADQVAVSLNQTAAVVLTDFEYPYGGTLWYVTEKEQVKVAEDVANYYISDDGTGVAYITDYDTEYQSGTLHLFNGSKQKSETIDHDVFISYLHVSPNGKSVTYVKDYDEDYGEASAYVKVDRKKPVKIGDRHVPIAISDKGKYVYFVKVSEDNYNIVDLYVKRGKKETRLRSNAHINNVDFIFNADYSQVIVNDENRSYFSQKGSEVATIGRYEIEDNSYPNSLARSWFMQKAKVYGFKDLAGVIYLTDQNALIGFNSAGESQTVVSRIKYNYYYGASPHAVKGKDSIVYIDARDRLVRKSLKKAEEKVLAEDASLFVASTDAKSIYYLDDYGDLYYVKGNSKPKKLMSDVEESSLRISPDGKHAIFLADYRRDAGTLYSSRNGGTPKRIADDVYSMIVTKEGLFYTQDYSGGTFDLYYSKNFSKSEKIAEEVDSLQLHDPRNGSNINWWHLYY